MTAGDQARLTKADERAFAKLLTEADDLKVIKLACAINHYEALAEHGKARLARRKPETPTERFWDGGYRQAMREVLAVINEMSEASHRSRDILEAVAEVALAAHVLATVEFTAESWAGSES